MRFTPGKNETRIVSIGYLNWLYRDFQGHDRYYAYLHARRIPGLMCIHSHEGAWNAYNPAGYYGGLQMDWSFMRTYGWDMLRKYHWRDARYWSPDRPAGGRQPRGRPSRVLALVQLRGRLRSA